MSQRWRLRLGGGSVYLLVAALLILGRLVSPGFWSGENLLQVVRDVSILGIVAVGMSFITLSVNFVDLSAPVIMACSGIVSVALLPCGFLPALIAGLAMGGVLGLVNGWVVGYLRLNPILWTLAWMSVCDGVTRWAYGGKWIYAGQDTVAGSWIAWLYQGQLLGVVPVAVVLLALVAAAGDFVMRRTGYGRALKLTGAGYEAARLSGVGVRGVVLRAFLISGLASALAGLIKTSLNMYGDVEIGLGYDFQAITAVVIGGVSLAGGRGAIGGVLGG
ncbi:MAG: ABC transporter permease, partial [Armatimonadetes bacterium]|nr:ABC transporter permease [Armatimonadota bacterium]